MEMVWIAGVCTVTALVVAGLTHWIMYGWRNHKRGVDGGVLPPGSLGLPLVGETLELMIPSYSLDLIPFLKKRIQRYGKVFRTSVAGRTIVVSADPEFCHYVRQHDGKLFESWYMDTFSKLFEHDMTNVSNIHRYVRTVVLRHFGMDALKQKLLAMMEQEFRAALRSWSDQEAALDIKYASGTLALGFGAKQLFSYKPPPQSSDKLEDLYFSFVKGLMSIPLNIPGTTHNKCLQNHKKALSIIRETVKERLASMSGEEASSDLLDHIIRDMKSEEFLTEELVVQLLFGLLFVAYESASTTLSLALKLLDEHPQVLQKLNDEHEAILESRENPDSQITWDEYKSMSYTLQVINEVLRLGNTSPGLFRRAKKDIQVNGFTTPAGWGILVATSALHMDPETYKDPTTFNPSRWKDCKSEAMLKNFMPFGWGMKQCAGAEYSRVFLATFLHVLVTGYRWKVVDGGKICRAPMLNFGKGIRVKFTPKHA